VVLRVEFEHEAYKGFPYTNIRCFYTRARLSGSNTATATLEKLHVEFGGTLPLNATRSTPSGEKAKHLCPAEAEMSLSLPITEDEPGETEVIEEQIAP
jgi:hypothetical protein